MEGEEEEEKGCAQIGLDDFSRSLCKWGLKPFCPPAIGPRRSPHLRAPITAWQMQASIV